MLISMKALLSGLALLLFLTSSGVAQIMLPNRPAGVVTADHAVITRWGSNDYLLHAPAPSYPAGMAHRGLSGRGVFVADLSMLYGTVNDVRVLYSTGSQELDDTAIAALRTWVFRRWTIYKAAIPVEFDASGRVRIGTEPGNGPAISAILAQMSETRRSGR
jgi:TonB family protein